jgi:hypothetical protein
MSDPSRQILSLFFDGNGSKFCSPYLLVFVCQPNLRLNSIYEALTVVGEHIGRHKPIQKL